jgi:hypothetical protein
MPEKNNDAYEAMSELAIKMRGIFIHHFALIEDLFHVVITSYFCSDRTKRFELTHRVVATKMISFENKQAILGFIYTKAPKDFKEKYPDVMKRIANLQILRNTFAHWTINHSSEILDNYDGKTVEFIEIKTERQEAKIHRIKIDTPNFYQAIDDIKYVGSILLEWIKILEGQSPPK